MEQGRYAEIVAALQPVMKQSAYARDADWNKWMGQALCMTSNYAESVRFLETAIRQNRKSGAYWYLAIARQHLYEFDGALEALDSYRPVLTSDLWIERADSLEAAIRQGLRAYEHVQDVVIIDSLSVPRATFFERYKLGAESGRVAKGEDGLYYENQVADYRIYAIGNQLYECHKIQDKWQEKERLEGLGSEEFRVIDPFMRSDGVTLYFACDSMPGLGGLDIYKTRFNSEEGEFYQPERLGMPFNSLFDDYMLAIDETHQVGWWATDRKQDPDNVTIYLFQLEDNPRYVQEPSPSRARIDNVSETWRDPAGYAGLVADIMNAPQSPVKEAPKLHIVINDHKVYTSKDQFTRPGARAAYEESVNLQRQISSVKSQLEVLRREFNRATGAKRKQYRPQILQLEYDYVHLTAELEKQEKLYRRLEQ